MSESEPSPEGSVPLNRRDLLRLGAAASGIPLIAHTSAHPAAGGPTIPVDPDIGPWEDLSDSSGLAGMDHPEARATNIRNLMLIGLGMHNFTAVSGGRLPTAAITRADKAILSWRVAILPYIEEYRLYQRFHLDEPWDSPHNKPLLKEMPRTYAPVAQKGTPPFTTYFQGFVGPGSVFEGDEGTKIIDVVAAFKPTLMIAQAERPVLWTKPDDMTFDAAKPLPKLGGPFADGTYVGFADGSVRLVKRTITPEKLRALITQRRRQFEA
jgi:Protein of unknown function (DUF1559)